MFGEDIKAKGVKDYWLVPTGFYRGVISLGLFANRSRAEIQLGQLQKRGIEAQIEQKRARKLRYRVSLHLQKAPAEVFEQYDLNFDPGLLEQAPCAEPAG